VARRVEYPAIGGRYSVSGALKVLEKNSSITQQNAGYSRHGIVRSGVADEFVDLISTKAGNQLTHIGDCMNRHSLFLYICSLQVRAYDGVG